MPNKRVLLVHDDPQARSYIKSVLAEEGFTVLEARSGLQAIVLSAKQRGPLDLLLIQADLSGMSGRQLAEKFAHPFPETPVIFLAPTAKAKSIRASVRAVLGRAPKKVPARASHPPARIKSA